MGCTPRGSFEGSWEWGRGSWKATKRCQKAEPRPFVEDDPLCVHPIRLTKELQIYHPNSTFRERAAPEIATQFASL